MRPILTRLARALSILCAILFVVSLAVSMLLANSETRLFDAAIYKNALKSQDYYARMPHLMAVQIASNLASPSPASYYLKFITAQDWELLINTLVPQDQIQMISEQSLDSTFDFLNGKNEDPVISIAPLKKILVANSAEAVSQFLAAQPACTIEQLNAILAIVTAGGVLEKSMFCNPPAEVMTSAMPAISIVFESQIAALPDTIQIVEQSRLTLRDSINKIRLLADLSLLLPLVLLALITLMAVNSMSSWLKWWGFLLSLGGALTIALVFLAAPLASLAIFYAAAQNKSMVVLQLVSDGLDVIQVIIQQVTFPILAQAFVITLAGLVMVALGALVGRRRKSTI